MTRKSQTAKPMKPEKEVGQGHDGQVVLIDEIEPETDQKQDGRWQQDDHRRECNASLDRARRSALFSRGRPSVDREAVEARARRGAGGEETLAELLLEALLRLARGGASWRVVRATAAVLSGVRVRGEELALASSLA